MAVYWTLIFCSQYAENSDTNSITIKDFNVEPQDVYPSFSLCFSGTNFYWRNDLGIFNAFGLNRMEFEKMLKGETAIRYERNHSFQSYNKVPTFTGNGSKVNFQRLHLKLTDFLEETLFSYENSEETVHYVNDRHSDSTPEPHIHLSYLSPDVVCFTRDNTEPLNSIRVFDMIALNTSIFEKHEYENTELKIFVHYPGQLMRSFGKPKYTATAKFLKRLGPAHYPTSFEFRISQIKMLRKRPGSNTPCEPDILNEDEYLQKQIIKELGCIPIYWKNLSSEENRSKVCGDPKKLKIAYKNITDVKNIMAWNVQPCNEMLLHTSDNLNVEPEIPSRDGAIIFYYTDKMYEQIQYKRTLEFENWLSNVGGYVGMFLGYSMMQLPELMLWMFDFFYERKYKGLEGELYFLLYYKGRKFKRIGYIDNIIKIG